MNYPQETNEILHRTFDSTARSTTMIKFVILLVTLGTLSCASDQPSPRDQEIAQVRTHLQRAETLVQQAQLKNWTPAQQLQRARVLQNLRTYIAAEAYPENDIVDEQTPIFIDRFGARCAMAALIEASGDSDLVQRIASNSNLARIRELRDDADLLRWLDDHGITIDEAAAIQPSYSNTTAQSWHPTASVVVGIWGGSQLGGTAPGAQVDLGFGVRVGARHRTGRS
jgi:hypothetical protein